MLGIFLNWRIAARCYWLYSSTVTKYLRPSTPGQPCVLSDNIFITQHKKTQRVQINQALSNIKK